MFLLKNTNGFPRGWRVGCDRQLFAGEKIDRVWGLTTFDFELLPAEGERRSLLIINDFDAEILLDGEWLPSELVVVFVGEWWAVVPLNGVSAPDEEAAWDELDEFPGTPNGAAYARGWQNAPAANIPRGTLWSFLDKKYPGGLVGVYLSDLKK